MSENRYSSLCKLHKVRESLQTSGALLGNSPNFQKFNMQVLGPPMSVQGPRRRASNGTKVFSLSNYRAFADRTGIVLPRDKKEVLE